MFASRTMTHFPFCFCRMDNVGPERLTGAPPLFGVTVMVRVVQT